VAANSIEVGPTLPAQIASAAAHKKFVVPVQLERFGAQGDGKSVPAGACEDQYGARVGACDIPDGKHGCVCRGQPAVAGGQHDAHGR